MNLRDALVIDMKATLGDLVFKKFEKSVTKYEDGKNTGEVVGYKFKVESSRLMDVIDVTITDPLLKGVEHFEQTPEKFYNKPVQFEGLKISPYPQTGGSGFASIGWSIKADAIKFPSSN